MEYYLQSNYQANSGCSYEKPIRKRMPECTCKKLTACKGTCIA